MVRQMETEEEYQERIKKIRFEEGGQPIDKDKFTKNKSKIHLESNTDNKAIEFVNVQTGEILELRRVDFDSCMEQEDDNMYKHRNSLPRVAALLSITDRKCEQINDIYKLSSALGVFVQDSSLKTMLGKNWERTLEQLRKEEWIKRVFSTQCQYYAYKPTDIHWMINPDFTVMRDKWSRKRKLWLDKCYKNGLVNTYIE